MDDDTLDLLANYSKKKTNKVEKNIEVIKKPEDYDDNSEILKLLKYNTLSYT